MWFWAPKMRPPKMSIFEILGFSKFRKCFWKVCSRLGRLWTSASNWRRSNQYILWSELEGLRMSLEEYEEQTKELTERSRRRKYAILENSRFWKFKKIGLRKIFSKHIFSDFFLFFIKIILVRFILLSSDPVTLPGTVLLLPPWFRKSENSQNPLNWTRIGPNSVYSFIQSLILCWTLDFQHLLVVVVDFTNLRRVTPRVLVVKKHFHR